MAMEVGSLALTVIPIHHHSLRLPPCLTLVTVPHHLMKVTKEEREEEEAEGQVTRKKAEKVAVPVYPNASDEPLEVAADHVIGHGF